MTRDFFVAGTGLIQFSRPGAGTSYDHIVAQAIRPALADAHLYEGAVQPAYASGVSGERARSFS